jgi:anti-sigma B factor antagonist
MDSASDFLRLEMAGGTIVISPVGDMNSFSAELLSEAAEMMSGVIESQEPPMLVIDLSGVPSCSSVFMSFLLKCHKAVKGRNGEMVLSGLSQMLRELLSLTRLDTVWAVYQTRAEALEAVR